MTAAALSALVGQNLRRSRRAVLLSTFGIAVGISSLVFFLALSEGVRRTVLAKVFPIDRMEVVQERSSLDATLGLLGGPRPLTDEVWQTLKARPEVRAAYRRMKLAFPARAWGGQALLGRDVEGELIAEGIDPEATSGDSIGPEPFSVKPDDHPVPAVISPFVVEIYNTTIAPSHGLPKIGLFLVGRLRGFSFNAELGRSFLGVGRSAGTPRTQAIMLVGVSARAAPLALSVPLEYVRRWNREFAGEAAARELSSVLLELKPGADVTRLTEAVRALGFGVADSGAERVGLALTLLTLLFALVSAAILSVAVINIAHGFFRVVAERRREIGLYRALGASRADVAALILVEAAIVGLGGGGLGVAVARCAGFLADRAAARFVPDFPFKPDSFFSFGPSIVLGALACAVGACLLGAALPARSAARLDPALALAAD
jgi:ABC-type antimicrobial peptide transport system permease subunit